MQEENLLATCHLPGREAVASRSMLWDSVKWWLQPFQDPLDRYLNLKLLPQLNDPNGYGKVLFDILFGGTKDWEPVLRLLFDRPDGPRPNPTLHPVRLRIHVEDPLLAGLPWRIAVWNRQPLLDAGWVFTMTHTLDPTADLLSTAPFNVLVVAPQLLKVQGGGPHEPEHARAVFDVLQKAWPTGRDAGYVQVARTRADLEQGLRDLRPLLLYAYGYGSVMGGRPCLLLEGETGGVLLSLAGLPAAHGGVGAHSRRDLFQYGGADRCHQPYTGPAPRRRRAAALLAPPAGVVRGFDDDRSPVAAPLAQPGRRSGRGAPSGS